MSHAFTTPAESLEIATPSSACRVMDWIETEVDGVDSRSLVIESVDRVLICQNLIDWFWDPKMREEEEKVRDVMLLL